MAASEPDIWRVMGELSLPWEHANLTDEMGRKQLVLLAILAIAARPVPREDLATLLWPDSDRQAARHNLRQALVSIRKALGERADAAIIADFDGVALRPHALRTDIGRLREIAAGADTSAGEVLDLCRGPLLEGFSLASHAFEDQLEVWRQEAAALSVMAIDRVLADARPAEREILFVRRQFFVPAQAGQEGPQLPAMRPPAEGAGPRRQSGSSWRRRVAVLVKGLALGTAVVIALLAVPNIRDLIERVLPPPPSITVRSFLSGNDTVVERNLAGLVTGTVTYGLAAVPERKLFVVRAPAEDNVARISDTEFAAELGVRYVITGTLEHDDGTVRVTVNCFDAKLGEDVWLDRFTRPRTDPFQLPDDIAVRILGELDIELSNAERNRIQYLNDTDNLDAWLLAVNGVSNLIKLTLGGLQQANMAYGMALAKDPEYISARRGIVWHALLLVRFGMAKDPDATIKEARNHLDVILRHKPDHGMSRALEGFMLLLENSWDKAIPASEEASRLLPGSADVWAVLAHGYTYVGENEKAIEAIGRAKLLSPSHPRFYNWIEARALRLAGQTEQAIALLDQEVPPEEESLVRLVELVAAYMASDRKDDAIVIAEKVRQIDPDFRASTWVLHPAIQDPDLQSLEFELLSKAGL